MAGCKQPVLVHFDYVPNSIPVLTSGASSLEKIYDDAGLAVDVKSMALNLPSGACVDVSNIDQLITSTNSLKESMIDDATPWWDIFDSFPPWYTHGMSLPCCTGAIAGYECGGYDGFIWLGMDLTTTVREQFVVINKNDSQGVVNLEGPMMTTVHELGHVLNLHHCEYDHDGLYTNLAFGSASLEHLQQHPEECRRPGSEGLKWCEMSTPHQALHDQLASTPSCSSDVCSGASHIFATPSPEGVEMAVTPEKPEYIEGEPIRVDIVLRAVGATPGIVFLGAPSLDPNLGYLKFWAASSRESLDRAPAADLTPLRSPVLAETRLSPEKFDGAAGETGVASSGLDIWYALPQAGLDGTKPFFIKTTQAGFQDASRRPLVAFSQVADIAVVRPGPPLFDSRALELFTSEEARRFMFALGGDHLKRGRDALARVAHDFPDTIYAPYANLALGMSLTRPFYTYDPVSKTVIRRDPKLAEAREHLEQANHRRDLLSRSYRVVLDEVLAQTYTRLGDDQAGSNQRVARDRYHQAAQQYQKIAEDMDRHRPPSLRERKSQASAQTAIREIAEKVRRLPPR